MNFKTQRDISHPPLITPSASPPPRPLSSRTETAPSPSKRQRLASVSRSSSLRRSASASDSNLDIQREREASRVRLLDTWSQLAERYSRPLDEDDIVDIRTGEIVKDNGFWRTTRQYKFGEVLAPEYQEETTAEESEDEDGIDELDAFPEEHDFLEDVFARGLQKVTAVDQNVGSEDEDDLEEFLRAEQRRKEEYGSDFEEESIDSHSVVGEGAATPSSPYPPRDLDDEGDDFNDGILDDIPGTNSSAHDSAPENPGSDDELDNWEPTEASMVVVARGTSDFASENEQSDLESEVEIVEPESSIKSLVPKQGTPPTQLHTPPHSHSSLDQPITGCIDIPCPSSTPVCPVEPQHPRQTRNASVSPRKSSAKTSKSKNSVMQRRAATPPDVIDLTDDDEASEPRSSLIFASTSHLPPPSVPPSKRARNRAQSVVPQVVITTLPPRMGQIKHTNETRGSKSNLGYPAKSTKQSIISAALSKTTTPRKPPIESTPPGPSPRTSPTTKSSQKVTSAQPVPATQKPEKATPSKSKLTPHHRTSPPREYEGSARDEVLSTIQRELSPEIGNRPVSPGLSTRQSPARLASHSPPKTRTGRKRKRSSSEYEGQVRSPTPEKPSKEAAGTRSRKTTIRHTSDTRNKVTQRSRSKPRHVTPVEDTDPSSSDDEVVHLRRHSAPRFASVSASMQSTYPLPSTPSHHPGMYPPVADPRAQQIITSAMQQLAALLWTPPTHSRSATPMYPYTPTHHRCSSVGPTFLHSTPEQPHPYPFSFDPSFSKATLPPSSPEPPSSPIKPRERRKSIVSRSQSRGRRVSFCVNDTDGNHLESGSESSTSEPLKATAKRHHRRRKDKSLSPKRSEIKGKGKAVERSVSPSESEAEKGGYVDGRRNTQPARARSMRAQTPGPASPLRDRASTSISRARNSNKGPSKQRKKHNRGDPND